MPKLSKEDEHRLNNRPSGFKCSKCGEEKERVYDESRDEWQFLCACPPPPKDDDPQYRKY